MKKFLQKKLKDQKGMTLIELLAVIVILAIIAAIAIPAIGNIIENSRVGTAKSDILNAQAAAELYLADNPKETTVTLDNLLGEDNSGEKTANVGSSYLDSQATLVEFEYNKGTKTIYAIAETNGNIRITAGTTSTNTDPNSGVTKADVSSLPSNTKGMHEGPNGGKINVDRDAADIDAEQ